MYEVKVIKTVEFIIMPQIQGRKRKSKSKHILISKVKKKIVNLKCNVSQSLEVAHHISMKVVYACAQ